MTRKIEHKEAIFFKIALPRTENAVGNATYLRQLDSLPNGVEVHEIMYHQERWTVGKNDFLTLDEARAKSAGEWKSKLDALPPQSKAEAQAATLGVSVTTLRKRQKLINEWL